MLFFLAAIASLGNLAPVVVGSSEAQPIGWYHPLAAYHDSRPAPIIALLNVIHFNSVMQRVIGSVENGSVLNGQANGDGVRMIFAFGLPVISYFNFFGIDPHTEAVLIISIRKKRVGEEIVPRLFHVLDERTDGLVVIAKKWLSDDGGMGIDFQGDGLSNILGKKSDLDLKLAVAKNPVTEHDVVPYLHPRPVFSHHRLPRNFITFLSGPKSSPNEKHAKGAQNNPRDCGRSSYLGPPCGDPLGSKVLFFALILACGLSSLIYAVRAISRDAGAAASGYLAFGIAGVVAGSVGCIAFVAPALG